VLVVEGTAETGCSSVTVKDVFSKYEQQGLSSLLHISSVSGVSLA